MLFQDESNYNSWSFHFAVNHCEYFHCETFFNVKQKSKCTYFLNSSESVTPKFCSRNNRSEDGHRKHLRRVKNYHPKCLTYLYFINKYIRVDAHTDSCNQELQDKVLNYGCLSCCQHPASLSPALVSAGGFPDLGCHSSSCQRLTDSPDWQTLHSCPGTWPEKPGRMEKVSRRWTNRSSWSLTTWSALSPLIFMTALRGRDSV